MIKLIAGDFTLDAAAGDMPRRTISGTAVPYNVEAVVSDGTQSFSVQAHCQSKAKHHACSCTTTPASQ
jgi:hypothetical protein